MASSSDELLFDRASVRAIDAAAMTEFGIPGIVLMENAARGLCEHALNMLRDSAGDSVLIVCGSGNNGGDGYALARHLHNHHVNVVIVAVGEPKPESDAGINRAICERMGLPIIDARTLEAARFAEVDLIVDAIFGTGLDRAIDPASDAGRAIEAINASRKPILAVDVPSGVNCDTGQPVTAGGPCVTATRTVTFVGMKVGFFTAGAQDWLGVTFVCDIGAPRELIERLAVLKQTENG